MKNKDYEYVLIKKYKDFEMEVISLMNSVYRKKDLLEEKEFKALKDNLMVILKGFSTFKDKFYSDYSNSLVKQIKALIDCDKKDFNKINKLKSLNKDITNFLARKGSKK